MILDAKVKTMDSLSEHQKKHLIKTLKKFRTLFSGGLGAVGIEPENCIVGEKELLGIGKGLKAFKNMLRGMEIIVYTDHLNLLY